MANTLKNQRRRIWAAATTSRHHGLTRKAGSSCRRMADLRMPICRCKFMAGNRRCAHLCRRRVMRRMEMNRIVGVQVSNTIMLTIVQVLRRQSKWSGFNIQSSIKARTLPRFWKCATTKLPMQQTHKPTINHRHSTGPTNLWIPISTHRPKMPLQEICWTGMQRRKPSTGASAHILSHCSPGRKTKAKGTWQSIKIILKMTYRLDNTNQLPMAFSPRGVSQMRRITKETRDMISRRPMANERQNCWAKALILRRIQLFKQMLG